MEILTPIDLTVKAEQIKKIGEEIKATLEKSICGLLPKGYVLEVDRDMTVVYKKPDCDKSAYYGICNAVLTIRHNGTCSIFKNQKSDIQISGDRATPKDIYRLSGIMQLLIIDDLQLIPNGSKFEGQG